MKIPRLCITIFFFLFLLSFTTIADEGEKDDITIFNLELEKVLSFGSGILAAVLLYLTTIAYQRTQNKRLKYVSIAFALFAIKGFLIAHELFFEEWSFVDPLAILLDFAILLTFFFGIIKK